MSSRASPEPAALADAYRAACRLELAALKPGNVHRHAEGHGMTVADFAASAEVSAAPLTAPGRTVGERVLSAARATHAAVGLNTNLGILLLAAPLLAAAEDAAGAGLRAALAAVLDRLTVADSVLVYEAIRLANPAGLGQVAEADVAAPTQLDLGRAMALAAGRDRIARQYVTAYADVLDFGLERLAEAHAAGASPEWATTYAYMSFLAAFPDSHVARKRGAAAAEAVRKEAAALGTTAHEAVDQAPLLAFDRALKSRGINPGTSADLTVTSLLAHAIADILPLAAMNYVARKR